MLRRTIVTSCAVVAIVLGAASPVLAAGTPGSGVQCPPNDDTCVVSVGAPGAPGTGGGDGGSSSPSGGAPTCFWPITHQPIACHSVDGWWSTTYECYFQVSVPQPPADSPVWARHFPTGVVYDTTCPDTSPGTGGGWMWLATPPDGFGGGGPTPADLAARAVKQLPIAGPDIQMAPGPGKTGLVGLPVWMWTQRAPLTWGPTSATAAVPGLAVTATATAQKIVWSMGDGNSVTCASPGTAYDVALGGGTSPNCGYVYDTSSRAQPGGKYVVTATTTWAVTWVGGGQSGALTVTRTSTSAVSIGELQVLVS
jgi:hypothetical protein